MEEAHALQIVKINHHKFELDEDLLAEVLQKPEIRDRKVVIVSVAGAFRKGKSFLLTFFLRYLYAQYVKKDLTKWIGKGKEILKGFSWRSGPERETTGILMWSDIFVHENVAIIILDTQGVYDNESTAKDCAFIFALSTLISSVQVFNLSQNILETDLQHLHLFTEYGKFVLESSDRKPFQKLQFLIRDWNCNVSHEYGASGGKDYLNKVLEITDQQHEELKSVRQFIKKSFSEIECYLMPHPGLSVAKETFNGKLKHVSDDFKKHIKDLVPLLLSPENLVLKEINGSAINVKDLIPLFGTYVKFLGNDEIPSPSTILHATAEANHKILFEKALDLYIKEIEKIIYAEVLISEEKFKIKHDYFSEESLNFYDEAQKIGDGSQMTETFRTNLVDTLKEKFIFYNQCNNTNKLKFESEMKAKNFRLINEYLSYYQSEMNDFCNSRDFVEWYNLDAQHASVCNTLIEKFRNQKQVGETDIEGYKYKLIEGINKYFESCKAKNRDKEKILEKSREVENEKYRADCALQNVEKAKNLANQYAYKLGVSEQNAARNAEQYAAKIRQSEEKAANVAKQYNAQLRNAQQIIDNLDNQLDEANRSCIIS